jgi:hypothetical protein
MKPPTAGPLLGCMDRMVAPCTKISMTELDPAMLSLTPLRVRVIFPLTLRGAIHSTQLDDTHVTGDNSFSDPNTQWLCTLDLAKCLPVTVRVSPLPASTISGCILLTVPDELYGMDSPSLV